MVELGQKVKDRVSGFSGIATAKTDFLFDCLRVQVTSTKLKDGKPIVDWFDEDSLEVMGKGLSKTEKKKKVKPTGGARNINPQRNNCVR